MEPILIPHIDKELAITRRICDDTSCEPLTRKELVLRMTELNMMSVAAFAAKVGLSARQVERLIQMGVIRAQKIGRTWIIPVEEVKSKAFKKRRKFGRPVGTTGIPWGKNRTNEE